MKRMIALLLAAVMLMALMAGCAKAPTAMETEGIASTQPVTTNPTSSDPAPTNPVPTDPTPTEPTPTESLPTELTPTEPIPTEPIPTEPAPTQPVPTQPAPTQPAPTKPAPTKPAPTQPEPFVPAIEEVTLTVWVPQEDRVNGGWLETVMRRFVQMHPEYSILWNIETCPEADAAIMVGQDPAAAADVYMFSNEQMSQLINAGALLRVGGSYLEQVVNDNSPTTVNTVTYTDGFVYGFPITNNTWYMYYDKYVFTKEDIKSLDSMLAKGKVSFPMDSGYYNGSFFTANGCTLFGDKGNDSAAGIQFGGKKGYEAAEKMVELAQNPNLVCDFTVGAFWLGDVGACFSGSWDYESLRSCYGDRLGVAPLPMVEIGGKNVQMRSFAGSRCVGVNPYSKNTQVALMFASFMAEPENQLLRFEMRGVIPAAKELINEPVVKSSELAATELFTMTHCSIVQPTVSEISYYWRPMEDFGAAIMNGEITLSNLMEKVDALVRELNNQGL